MERGIGAEGREGTGIGGERSERRWGGREVGRGGKGRRVGCRGRGRRSEPEGLRIRVGGKGFRVRSPGPGEGDGAKGGRPEPEEGPQGLTQGQGHRMREIGAGGGAPRAHTGGRQRRVWVPGLGDGHRGWRATSSSRTSGRRAGGRGWFGGEGDAWALEGGAGAGAGGKDGRGGVELILTVLEAEPSEEDKAMMDIGAVEARRPEGAAKELEVGEGPEEGVLLEVDAQRVAGSTASERRRGRRQGRRGGGRGRWESLEIRKRRRRGERPTERLGLDLDRA